MTVVWNGLTPAVMVIENTDSSLPSPVALRMQTNINNNDAISCEYIRLLTQGQELSVSSAYNTSADATTGSAWGGFLLDSLMSPLVGTFYSLQ